MWQPKPCRLQCASWPSLHVGQLHEQVCASWQSAVVSPYFVARHEAHTWVWSLPSVSWSHRCCWCMTVLAPSRQT
jgi:hypothetical protein